MHIVVQPSPRSVSRTFSSFQTETLNSLNNNSPSLHCFQPLATTILLSVSINLTTIGTSCKWNHTVIVLCDWLVSVSIIYPRLYFNARGCFLPQGLFACGNNVISILNSAEHNPGLLLSNAVHHTLSVLPFRL